MDGWMNGWVGEEATESVLRDCLEQSKNVGQNL